MIDAVICDMQMPTLSGSEAIAYFRAQFPSVPILVMTGHPSARSTAKIFEKGLRIT